MKNYLEHDEKVKYLDAIFAKKQDWQWFVNLIESNYDLEDVECYSEFNSRKNALIDVLAKFIKIVEVSQQDLSFKHKVLEELYLLSHFYLGIKKIEECRKNINSNVVKLLLAVVWITKIENADNDTDYVADFRFLEQKNYWKAIRIDSIEQEKDEIEEYLNTIEFKGLSNYKKCILDNLNCVSYGVTEGFFDKYSDDFISVNAFSYQTYSEKTIMTWQETSLLDMISVSITKNKLIPLYSIGGTSVPNIERWNHEHLDEIKDFFHNEVADFVIETIDYIKNDIIPKTEVVDLHCKLLTELIKSESDLDIRRTSSYVVLAKIFSSDSLQEINKTDNVISFIKEIQKIKEIDILLWMNVDKFPLSKEQKRIIKQHIVSEYKKIKEIDEIGHLMQYSHNINVARSISQEYYDIYIIKLNDVIKKEQNNQLIANLLIYAMDFLMEINQTNIVLDKTKIKRNMIELQEVWENSLYKIQCEKLNLYSYSISIPKEEVDVFNKNIIDNPYGFAEQCIYTDENRIIKQMEMISKHALLYKVKRIHLNSFFPEEEKGIMFDNHDIDSAFKDQINKINESVGYKFLNKLDEETYVYALYKYFSERVLQEISFFAGEKEVYNIIEDKLNVSLIPYTDEIKLGHLTQLFPLLEKEIRRLGKIHGIVPFKEKRSEKIKFKDPSSILRELLLQVYNEIGSFERVEDLLFVYHCLYNGNSLNIRNESIHGREFVQGRGLKIAFKITEISLYMIIYRISQLEQWQKSQI